jgi:hypothetical protein
MNGPPQLGSQPQLGALHPHVEALQPQVGSVAPQQVVGIGDW